MAHQPATKSLRILRRCAPLRRLVRRANSAGLLYLAATSAAALLSQSAAAQSNLPALKIEGSNDSVNVRWPLSGYYFVLETKTNLFSSALWQNFSTASKILSSLPTPTLNPGSAMLTTNTVGEEISVTVPVTNVQQLFRLEGAPFIPVFSFGVFYNGLLEFTTCPTLTVNGPAHANGPIYVGSSSPLYVYETMTTSGTISSPANNGSGPWPFPGTVSFSANPPYITNVPALTLPIGTNNPYVLIDYPAAGVAPNSGLGQQLLYNQAQVVLQVTDSNVTTRIQAAPSATQVPGQDPSPVIISNYWGATSWPATNSAATNIQAQLSANFPFLTLTNAFLDQREDKTNLVTQIDVGKYAKWITTNASILSKFPSGSGTYPTILWVADNRRANSATLLSVVRLTNGIVPPANGGHGWSVATPNPLYVWGNYNCTNLAYLATTNTAATYPCAFMSDALTILSSSWRDNTSFTISSTGPDAAPVNTVNAAILTGIKPSTSTNASGFSGGVHNLPRLLENWSNSHLFLNTSIVNLFNSRKAVGQFVTPGPGSYYVPATRHFSFDRNFTDLLKLPPGTPLVSVNWSTN